MSWSPKAKELEEEGASQVVAVTLVSHTLLARPPESVVASFCEPSSLG